MSVQQSVTRGAVPGAVLLSAALTLPPSPPSSGTSGLSTGALVGIIAAAVVVVGIGIIAAIVVNRSKSRKAESDALAVSGGQALTDEQIHREVLRELEMIHWTPPQMRRPAAPPPMRRGIELDLI